MAGKKIVVEDRTNQANIDSSKESFDTLIERLEPLMIELASRFHEAQATMRKEHPEVDSQAWIITVVATLEAVLNKIESNVAMLGANMFVNSLPDDDDQED